VKHHGIGIGRRSSGDVPRVMEPLLSPQDASAGVTTMAVGPPVFWILAVVENSHPLAS